MTREILSKDLQDAAKDTATAAYETVKDATNTLKDSATAATSAAYDAGNNALHDLKDHAVDLKSRATDAAGILRDEAETRMAAVGETLADGTQRLVKTLRDAAGQDDGTLRAQVLDVVAGGVSGVSDTLRGKSLGTLIADVQGFARRNPAVFVAGAAVAGFALARVLRSGTPVPSIPQTTSTDIENAFAKTILNTPTEPRA